MIETTKIKIEGIAPLLMHNGLLADPTNPFTMASKPVQAKKSKMTEEDRAFIDRNSWMGGLYVKDDKVIIPGLVLDSVIMYGARKTRNGKDVQCGVSVYDDPILEFPDKNKSLDWLYDSGKYIDRRMVAVQKARVARVRPRFNEWSLSFTVHFDNEVIDGKQLIAFIDAAGSFVGLGDFRPRFGRFKRV